MTERNKRNERCETCRFWECAFKREGRGLETLQRCLDEGVPAGFCHRYPPKGKADWSNIGSDEVNSTFVGTRIDDWCGEWQSPSPSITPNGLKKVPLNIIDVRDIDIDLEKQ